MSTDANLIYHSTSLTSCYVLHARSRTERPLIIIFDISEAGRGAKTAGPLTQPAQWPHSSPDGTVTKTGSLMISKWLLAFCGTLKRCCESIKGSPETPRAEQEDATGILKSYQKAHRQQEIKLQVSFISALFALYCFAD